MDWSAIPVISYVFFGVFVCASIVHLVFCYMEKELARKITKCMTTGTLFLVLVTAIPTHPLPYVALVFGVIGDACLLKKHKVLPFVFGMLSFLLNHVLNIAMFMVICGPLHWSYYAATALWVILFPIVLYHLGNRIVHQKHLAFGGMAYMGVLFLDLIWAIIACALGHVDYCLLGVFGGVCFIISDCFLVYTSFKRDVRRRDFFIMATYIVAQALIGVGFALTLLS